MRTLVMASGRGSNLRAIVQACEAGECDADVVAVLSDRADAEALKFAAAAGITSDVVARDRYADRGAWDRALAERAASHSPELIVLAGFMRILGAPILDRFEGRIINVHPALLPAFPGKDGPAMAIAAGVRISGCTVHVVDAGVDTGPILAQAAVPVLPDDDRDALHARIQGVEHTLLPRVVHAIARGRIRLGNPPELDTSGWPAPPDALVWPALG